MIEISGGPKFIIFVMMVAALGIIGWVSNILTLLGLTLEGNEIEAVVRILGIVFVPLGALMGWI